MTGTTPQIQISPDEDHHNTHPTDFCCFCIPYDVFTDDITNDYSMHFENKKKKEKRMRKLKENGIGRLTMYVLTGGKKGRFEVKKSAVEITESQLPDRSIDEITGQEYVKNIENKEKHDKILAKHGKTGPGYTKNEKFDFMTRISMMVPKMSALSIAKKDSKNSKEDSTNPTYNLNPANAQLPTITSGISANVSGSMTSEDKNILNAPERPGVMTENDFSKTQKAKDQKEKREKNAADRGKMRQKTVYYKSNSVFGKVFEKA